MSRGFGEFGPVQEVIPEWLAVVVALMTQLGDGWFLITLLALLYWTQSETQDEILLVGGILACGIGLYRGLKFLFGLPRPEQPLLNPELLPWIVQPLYEVTAHASGYGFPSGHATMTTIVYFGLATVLHIGTRRQRYLVAGAVVGLVSFSRIALGVHFFVDVVVGIALGALLLVAVFQLLEERTESEETMVFATAISLNVFYVVASNAHIEAVIMLGVTLGLFGGWQLILLARNPVVTDRPSESVLPATVHLGLAVAAFAPLVLSLGQFPILAANSSAIAGIVGLTVTIVVIVPAARCSTRTQGLYNAVHSWSSSLFDGILNLLRSTTWREVGQDFRKLLNRLWR